MRLRRIVFAFVLFCIAAQAEQPAEKESDDSKLSGLFTQLNDTAAQTREAAAEQLALAEGAEIPARLRQRLTVETNFHVRLALHYALAFQGDKEAFKALWKDADSRTGHLGFVYCSRIAGEQVEWAEMPKWIDKLSAEDFEKRMAHLRLPVEVRVKLS